jgi:hypothetical protein
MTNEKEKTDQMRKELDRFAERLFPNLSSPELVNSAIEFERTLK